MTTSGAGFPETEAWAASGNWVDEWLPQIITFFTLDTSVPHFWANFNDIERRDLKQGNGIEQKMSRVRYCIYTIWMIKKRRLPDWGPYCGPSESLQWSSLLESREHNGSCKRTTKNEARCSIKNEDFNPPNCSVGVGWISYDQNFDWLLRNLIDGTSLNLKYKIIQ